MCVFFLIHNLQRVSFQQLLGFSTSWESLDCFPHSISFSLPKQLCRKRGNHKFALLPVSNAVDKMSQPREREEGLKCLSLAAKLLKWLTPILWFSQRFLVATTNFLQAECWGRGDDWRTCGCGLFTELFTYSVAFMTWIHGRYLKTARGEQNVHLWVLGRKKLLGGEGEWEPEQVIGVGRKGTWMVTFLVQIHRQVFSVFPILYLLCSCALTFLTTHILSLFQFFFNFIIYWPFWLLTCHRFCCPQGPHTAQWE